MNRRFNNNNKKKTYIIIGISLFSLLLLGIFFLDLGHKPKSKVANPKFGPDNSLQVFKIDKPTTPYSAEQMFERIQKTRAIKLNFLVNSDYLDRVTMRCELLSQHEQLLDEECSAAWLYRLKYGEITNVYELLGFEDTHWGAIILEVDKKYKAVFKPCSTKSEDTTKEVIASHLDQVLGYGQTAPVITRRIKSDVIEKFATSPVQYDRLVETKTRCELQGGFLEGPMIGWWNELTPIRTVRKNHVELTQMDEMRKNLTYNLFTTQMQSKFHSFYWLINILRHGKDEFITPQGNLVSLDLDRSRYSYSTSPYDLSVNFTWCYTCYFDEYVYEIFNAIGPSQIADLKLSALLRESLSHEDIFANIWDKKTGDTLDIRVRQYLQCADNCITKYGRENVILNYDSNMSEKEIVNWFVYHSEYKNQNGKKGAKLV